jgi:hypothetical protein
VSFIFIFTLRDREFWSDFLKNCIGAILHLNRAGYHDASAKLEDGEPPVTLCPLLSLCVCSG